MARKIDETWLDKELGQFYLTRNVRSKRFSFRCYENGIQITAPQRFNRKYLLSAIEEMRPQLRTLVQKQQLRKSQQSVKHIDWDFEINTDSFHFCIKEGPTFQLHNECSGVAWLYCPPDTDFNERQDWLKAVITESLRQHAKALLPGKLRQLELAYGFSVRSVQIRNMHGRWGSCSSKQSIHLSIYVLLLPERLQRLVLLHELCHTIHMDHSAAFHAKLNWALEGQEETLNRELKNYHTDILTY